jgi:hypothetical protein
VGEGVGPNPHARSVRRGGSFNTKFRIARGSNGAPSDALWVDFGKNCFVLSDFAAIRQLPSFTDNYKPVTDDTIACRPASTARRISLKTLEGANTDSGVP